MEIFILLVLLILGFNEPAEQCGLPNEPVVVSYTKSGFPIYDDQAPLNKPCPPVTPPNGPQPPTALDPPVAPPVGDPPVDEPPVDEPPVTPPVEPPVIDPPIVDLPVDEPKPAKEKCNSGRGNGPEGNPDCDPGNSGGRNQGGD